MSSVNKIKKEIAEEVAKASINYQRVLELSSQLSKFDPNNFRFSIDAGTLVNLGRDSIKDHTTAIIELAKNGYDADATRIDIDIKYNDKEKKIRIADNGDGMTSDEVVNNWLRIGFSNKRKEKKSKKKRRRTGEKGIGRLSADRLGAFLQLLTKAKKSNAFGLKINWEDFNKQGIDLNTIPVKKIDVPKITIPKGIKSDNKSGTELIITELRNSWADNDLKNLWTQLSILTPPFNRIKDFEIWINTDIKTDFKGKVEPQFHQAAEVTITLKFDGKSDALHYSISNKYGLIEEKKKKISWKSLISGKDNFIRDIKKTALKEKLKCGPAEIHLLFYPRETSMIEGTDFDLKQLREYLDENNGIKIYRDNISVKPYGFPGVDGSDWLDLSLRQGQNPAGIDRPDWMAKPNQLIGAVFIGRDTNPQLKDSTAREGLIHEDAFFDLRALTLAGVRLLEIHRHKLFKLNPKKKKEKKSTRVVLEEYKTEIVKLKDELENLQEEAKENTVLRTATDQVTVVIEKTGETEKTIEELLDKARTLAGLATVGLSSAVFGHETQTSISEFKLASGNAKLHLEDEPPEVKEAIEELEKALKYADQVSAWGKFALSRVKRDKRRRIEMNVNEVISKLIKEIEPNFTAVGISIKQELSIIKAKVFAMDIETIILNLLTNAYSACLEKNSDRKIAVKLRSLKNKEKNGFEISVSDTGKGVDGKIMDMIWLPFFTTKVDEKGREIGTGLGLSIVESIVVDLQGKKEVSKDSILKGANFKIWLPVE